MAKRLKINLPLIALYYKKNYSKYSIVAIARMVIGKAKAFLTLYIIHTKHVVC